jgi:hypothetical protein
MSIHIERSGGPPDLPAAFAHFVVRHLRGRFLDDNKDEEAKLGKFPDFACYRDLVLIEMKHLETVQNERINETYKSRVPADEVPFYYGRRRIDLNQFSNGREIASAIISKLARSLETHLSRANNQFEDYRKRNPARIRSRSACFSTPKLMNSVPMSSSTPFSRNCVSHPPPVCAFPISTRLSTSQRSTLKNSPMVELPSRSRRSYAHLRSSNVGRCRLSSASCKAGQNSGPVEAPSPDGPINSRALSMFRPRCRATKYGSSRIGANPTCAR